MTDNRKAARYLGWIGCLLVGLFLLPAGARSEGENLAGQFLIATKNLNDPNFRRTVIYICRHNAEGALGLVLNRPMGKLPFATLLKPFGIESRDKREIPVRAGGPVQRNVAIILHTPEVMAGQALCSTAKGAITATVEMLRAMAEGRGPKRTRVFFGYSGWGAGQLEREMKQKSWETIPEDANFLFNDDADGMWERAKGRLGIDL